MQGGKGLVGFCDRFFRDGRWFNASVIRPRLFSIDGVTDRNIATLLAIKFVGVSVRHWHPNAFDKFCTLIEIVLANIVNARIVPVYMA